MSRKCFLKCFLSSHPPIPLPHDSQVFIGRSKDTQIKDQLCSRKQISLKANYDDCTVELKQIGVNSSGMDGFALTKDATYNIKHGTRLEILMNQYIHVIVFEPPPEGAEEIQIGNKRKLDEMETENKGKILKTKLDELPKIETKKQAEIEKDERIEIEKDERIEIENETQKLENISVKECNTDMWDNIDKGELYIFTSKGVKSSSKIAAFDMDGTLIKTKSGKVYPVDTNDWQINLREVPKKLKKQLDLGYKIIILTNQSPIGKGRVKIEDFKKKMEGIIEKIGIPIQAFIATGKGFYRKPTPGMWQYLQEKKNDNIPINMTESFYVGDAVGRVANWAPGKKKDHSLADRLLAENLGLKFYTPEEYFLGHSVKNVQFSKPEFDPRDLDLSLPFNDKLISKSKEILVLVGYPGSGKSSLAKQIESKSDRKYSTVCRDLLGSWQKCASEAGKLLQQGTSVIVDSTNPDLESRARWTSLAREHNVECRCANMVITFAHAKHNNKFRELTKQNHVPVADMVFYSYRNKYKEPKTDEGFKEVVEVKFSPSFKSEEDKKLYMMHLLEK